MGSPPSNFSRKELFQSPGKCIPTQGSPKSGILMYPHGAASQCVYVSGVGGSVGSMSSPHPWKGNSEMHSAFALRGARCTEPISLSETQLSNTSVQMFLLPPLLPLPHSISRAHPKYTTWARVLVSDSAPGEPKLRWNPSFAFFFLFEDTLRSHSPKPSFSCLWNKGNGIYLNRLLKRENLYEVSGLLLISFCC